MRNINFEYAKRLRVLRIELLQRQKTKGLTKTENKILKLTLGF